MRKGGFGTWAPLAGTTALILIAALRLVGHGEAAAALESVAGMVGLTQASPISASEIVQTLTAILAAVSAGWGVVRKLLAVWNARSGRSTLGAAAALALAIAGLATVSCTNTPGPTAPENVVVTINNNQNQNNGTGNQSPVGPGAGTCEAVRYVELSFAINDEPRETIAPGASGTITARALSASRSPITEGRCLPAATWAKTGACDLAGDTGAYTRTLTARPNATGTCGIDVTVSEAQGSLALPIR